jgi:hypothetical protein
VQRILDLVPGVGSLTNLTSAQILSAYIEPVEGLINARLAKLYLVPVTPAPPMLQFIADHLVAYDILYTRIYTPQRLKDSAWPPKFRDDAQKLLEQLAAGEITLITASGAVVTQSNTIIATSNTQNYHQTFLDDSIEEAEPDQRKLDDLADVRDEGRRL